MCCIPVQNLFTWFQNELTFQYEWTNHLWQSRAWILPINNIRKNNSKVTIKSNQGKAWISFEAIIPDYWLIGFPGKGHSHDSEHDNLQGCRTGNKMLSILSFTSYKLNHSCILVVKSWYQEVRSQSNWKHPVSFKTTRATIVLWVGHWQTNPTIG